MTPASPSPAPADPSASLDDLLAYARRVCASLYPGENPEDMVLAFRSGRKLSLMIPGSSTPGPATSVSEDGQVLLWFGRRLTFTSAQGKAVLLLYDAWKDKTRDVSGAAILEAADSKGDSVRDVFRNADAWNDHVISKGERRNTFRLIEPGEE